MSMPPSKAVFDHAESCSSWRSSSPGFISRRSRTGRLNGVQSDIVVSVDGVEFSLHKLPLVARSGKVRALTLELSRADFLSNPILEFTDFPGGPDSFESAAKFCYGIDIEMTPFNIAHLRCAAEYLEMTEDYGSDNLISRSEAYIEEVVLQSIDICVEVLRTCERLLPQLVEEIKLVNRCIDAIVSMIYKEQTASTLSRLECNNIGHSKKSMDASISLIHRTHPPCKATVEWWADDLSLLRIDIYQRLVAAMKSRCVRSEIVGGSLMLYAQKALKPQSKKQSIKCSTYRLNSGFFGDDLMKNKGMEHEQRFLIETIVSMLPTEKNIFPTSFLLGLLRSSTLLDTTVACRLDLEHKIGGQLEYASVDDLLIPMFPRAGDTLFDVDVVHRILSAYLQRDEIQEMIRSNHVYDTDIFTSVSQKGLTQVAKIVDAYLAEIATDPNLKVSKFLTLAEMLPDFARNSDDGLYRAIDIFLKAHPAIADSEKKRLCKTLDCQKLSEEACTHAAQNERLPVQLVVQVLYFEQLRMRNAISAPEDGKCSQSSGDFVYYGRTPRRIGGSTGGTASSSPKSTDQGVQRRNRELMLEVARLKILVKDLEKENMRLKQGIEKWQQAAQHVGMRTSPQGEGIGVGVGAPSSTTSSGQTSSIFRRLVKLTFLRSSQSRRQPPSRHHHHHRDLKPSTSCDLRHSIS